MPESARSTEIGTAPAQLTGYLTASGIGSTPGVIWYVRTGKSAETSSDSDFSRWWAEAEAERDTAQVAVAVLVVQRNGSQRVGNWWAAMDIATLITLASGDEIASTAYLLDDAPRYLVRMTLADAVEALRWARLVTPAP